MKSPLHCIESERVASTASRAAQALHFFPPCVRQLCGATTITTDVHMRKRRLGSSIVGAGNEGSQAKRDAGRTKARERKADLHRFRIGDRPCVSALRFDNEADRVASCDVEQTRADEPVIHRRVEPVIINGVVDVAIGVIVAPARGDGLPPAIVGTGPECVTRHGPRLFQYVSLHLLTIDASWRQSFHQSLALKITTLVR